MVEAKSPISGHQRPRSGRKPLQPKNSSFETKPKPNLNPAPAVWAEIELLDASLAEELSAIREKLERLRIDKDKTDKVLRERALLLDSQMKEMADRGMLQKQLEVEVDRLFQLKEIKLSCTSISLLRSLREKEQAKMHKQQDLFKAKNYSDERKEENPPNSQVKTENSTN